MGEELSFRFDELGRFQFLQLCREVVAAEFGATPSESHETPGVVVLSLPDGPVASAVWIPAGPRERQQARLHELLGQNIGLPRVITNIEADGSRIVDARALRELVESTPRLRLRLPSLLGICDEAAIVADDVRTRSSADVAAAFALARVFVPTRAYDATVDVLEQFGFAVLTGPPEMGKTAIARMLGLAKLSEGWEFHECIRPGQLWERFSRDRTQLFVADDAFGSTEYRPEAAERWAVELDRVLRAMDERHWLIWTSRPAPLKAGLRRIHREHGVERFPQPAEVQIDAADLDVEEKALILFRHAKAARLPETAVETVRTYGWRIVSHDHFTPERIRRFVAGRLLQPDVVEQLNTGQLRHLIGVEIREPTTAMAESFHALPPEYRSLLIALLDVPPGPVSERELSAAVRRHSPLAFARHPGELLDRLNGQFIRVVEAGAVTWVHPSWRDLVIDRLVLDAGARRAFLQSCAVDGLLLALSIGGGSAGTRSLPLLVEDCDWDAAADRLAALVPDLDEPSTTRLLIALAEAAEHELNDELDALAAYALELLTKRWGGRRDAIPVGLLCRWLELDGLISKRSPLPDLATTWIEALPCHDADEPMSAAELADVGDWLALAASLGEHAPHELHAFGFPDRYRELGSVLVARLRTGADRPRIVRLLRLLADVMPSVADEALRAAAVVATEAAQVETVPRESSPERLEVTFPRSAERLVMQVLLDL